MIIFLEIGEEKILENALEEDEVPRLTLGPLYYAWAREIDTVLLSNLFAPNWKNPIQIAAKE